MGLMKNTTVGARTLLYVLSGGFVGAVFGVLGTTEAQAGPRAPIQADGGGGGVAPPAAPKATAPRPTPATPAPAGRTPSQPAKTKAAAPLPAPAPPRQATPQPAPAAKTRAASNTPAPKPTRRPDPPDKYKPLGGFGSLPGTPLGTAKDNGGGKEKKPTPEPGNIFSQSPLANLGKGSAPTPDVKPKVNTSCANMGILCVPVSVPDLPKPGGGFPGQRGTTGDVPQPWPRAWYDTQDKAGGDTPQPAPQPQPGAKPKPKAAPRLAPKPRPKSAPKPGSAKEQTEEKAPKASRGSGSSDENKGPKPGDPCKSPKKTNPCEKAAKHSDEAQDRPERGEIFWRKENAHMSARARAYDSGAPGSRDGLAPALRYTKPGADRISYVKFDGPEEESGVMVDRKLRVTRHAKTRDQVARQAEGLRQNNRTGRWELPTDVEANNARKLFYSNGKWILHMRVRTVPWGS